MSYMTPAKKHKSTDGAMRAAKQIERDQSFVESTAEIIDRETGVRELAGMLENILAEAGDLIESRSPEPGWFSFTIPAAVVKRTRRFCRQAATQRLVNRCVLPVLWFERLGQDVRHGYRHVRQGYYRRVARLVRPEQSAALLS